MSSGTKAVPIYFLKHQMLSNTLKNNYRLYYFRESGSEGFCLGTEITREKEHVLSDCFFFDKQQDCSYKHAPTDFSGL